MPKLAPLTKGERVRLFAWLNSIRHDLGELKAEHAELSANARLVAWELSTYARAKPQPHEADWWTEGDIWVYPSQATVAHCTGLSERTVRRAIDELRRRRYIAVRAEVTQAGRRNYYRLRVPAGDF